MKTSFFNLFFLSILIICNSNAQELPLFNDGDNVALIGDSITHGGSYHAFIQLFCATQFPDQKVSYYDGGIAGDNAEGTLARLEKDILIHKPNHAIIMLGMNDVGRWLYPSSKKASGKQIREREKILKIYTERMNKLSAVLVKNRVKPVFMTPSIYDQTTEIECENNLGINDGLITFGEVLKDLAKKYNAPLVDLNAVMLDVNKKMQSKDKKATIVGQDRIHPGEEGHLVMAYEIIKTIFPVEYVSNIEIDAETKKVIRQVNCEVILNKDVTEFTILEKALPFPIKESLRPILELPGYHNNFTKEILSVKNLAKGKYKLLIDSVSIGNYSHKELSNGIDLSKNVITPQYKQAQGISDLCFEYRKTNNFLRTIAATEFRSLKDFKGPNTLEAKRAFLFARNEKSKGKPWYYYEKKKAKEYFEVLPKQDSLWSALNSIRDDIYSKNKPVAHTYKLVRG